MRFPAAVILVLVPGAGFAQHAPLPLTLDLTPLSIKEKGAYHFRKVVSEKAMTKNMFVISLRQAMNSPHEWGQGSEGFAKRFGARYATSASYHSMAFVLGAALHEDPRYFRRGEGPAGARVGSALWQVVTTRTDSGGRRFAFARFGAAIGTAFLSNTWQVDRRSTPGQALRRTGMNLAFAASGNLISEFWPDMKKLFGRGGHQYPARVPISSY